MFIKLFFKKHILLTAALIVLSLNANAQGVDPAYTPFPAVDASVQGGLLVPLAGGKLLALAYYGDFSAPLSRVLIKINADGSLDTFNCTACDFEIYSIAVQPDGQYLISGYTPSGSRFIRVNPDGSLDATFSNPFSAIPNNVNAFIHAVLPDGRIYASVKNSGATTGNGALYRVNTDGSIDNSFTPLVYNGFEITNYIRQIVPLPDGKIYVLGKHQNFGYVFRLNSDGSLDNGFSSPVFGNIFDIHGQPLITSGILQADGKLVIAGQFSSVNSIDRNCVARLNPDGGVDGATHSIQFIGGGGPAEIKAQPDGKIIVQKYSQDGRSFHRVNADLTTDATFTAPVNSQQGYAWTIDSNGKVVYFLNETLKRLNTDGSEDNTVTFSLPVAGKVAAIALQSDGKAIVSGDFTYLNGATHPTIGRLNTDGTTDAAFVTGTGFDSKPTELRVQADGKILALGNFNSYNGTSRPKLARLNADGSLDGSFTPSVSNANSIELQPDGKILVLGGSMGINGFGRTGVARLNSNGSLDASFNPVISSPTVWVAVVQADGKIVFGGTFGTINGVSRPNLARLNADGSLDLTFAPSGIGNTQALALQPDGKFLVGSVNPAVLKRLNANGSADASFNPPAIAGGALITSIVVETGGSIVVAGEFLQPRPNIFRVNANGTLDIAFVPSGANAIVRDLARQADNKIIAVGEFKTIGGVSRAGIARFNFSAFRAKTLFDFDGDGMADYSVTRPSDYNWYQLTGANYNFGALQFGQPGDKVTPADYDGDGKTDFAIFRPATGDWWYRKSTDGLQYSIHWGQNGDIPLSADYNGDGKSDFAVVRNYAWWIANSSGQTLLFTNFGQAGDKPMVGDFDGDGKADPAVYRPSDGTWYYAASTNNYVHTGFQWGIAEDIPVPADYDGDGKTDGAVFRPSEGNWYVLNSSNGTWIGLHFGLTGDKPIAADYDGDGKADIAVYRPSDHYWYVLGTTAGFYGFPFGLDTDIPSPNAFIQP